MSADLQQQFVARRAGVAGSVHGPDHDAEETRVDVDDELSGEAAVVAHAVDVHLVEEAPARVVRRRVPAQPRLGAPAVEAGEVVGAVGGTVSVTAGVVTDTALL